MTPPQPLKGLVVAVDVQHVYRTGAHAGDRGAVYTLTNGLHVAEADLALQYGAALIAALRGEGARVVTNDPGRGVMVGPYYRRQDAAAALGATLYLACHCNAGGGSYAVVEYADGSMSRGAAECVAAELATVRPWVSSGFARPIARELRGWPCVGNFIAGPALLIEPLFGDSVAHEGLLTQPGLVRIGQTIARGVQSWWGARGRLAAPVA